MLTLKQPRGLTAAFNSGLLTALGAETLYDTTAAIVYAIDGALYSKATVANGATPTTDVTTGGSFITLQPDQGCVFVWGVDAAGVVSVSQGQVAPIDPLTDEFSAPDAPQFGFVPDTVCPFAYQILQTAGTSSPWTFGSSNWNATGVTDVIVNVATLPSRPPENATS